MELILWLIVGLVAGGLASFAVGGTGFGLVGDVVIGIAGAFIGGWLLDVLGVAAPIGGLPGAILVAFIGAVVLLLALRLVRHTLVRA